MDPVGDINNKIINIGDYVISKEPFYPYWGKSKKVLAMEPHKPCDGPGNGYVVKLEDGNWEHNFNVKLDKQLNLF
jgi:hypothetical protein